MRRELMIALALAAGTVAVYAQVRRFEFVGYDDREYISENHRVQSGLTWENVSWAFTTGHASNWHPLTWLSLFLDFQISGAPDPFAFHLTNLVFHIANTVLLFAVFRRMTGALYRSALVAALFAWHP